MSATEEEKPIEEMSYHELDHEIGERTRHFNTNVDVPTGRVTVTALAIDRKHPPVTKSGFQADEVLRDVLRVLRGYGWPLGLVRSRRG